MCLNSLTVDNNFDISVNMYCFLHLHLYVDIHNLTKNGRKQFERAKFISNDKIDVDDGNNIFLCWNDFFLGEKR